MPDRVIGVAGVPGAWSSEAIAGALRAGGVESFVFPVSECTHHVSNGAVTWEGRDLTNLDGVVVKKLGDAADPLSESRIELLRAVEEAGVHVISSPAALARAVNRYSMTSDLARAGVPIPETIVTESIDEAERVVLDWGRAIVKPLLTSKGRGMILLSAGKAVRLPLKRWRKTGVGPMYVQRFVPNAGRDLGVAVLDGKIIGGYYRVASGDSWMTTTSAGGHYEAADISEPAAEIALKAVDVFKLDFSSVDLVESDGGWFVYEVSAFGAFAGLRRTGDVDAPGLYASYVLKKIYG